jgi:hypothetical protein
MEILIGAAPWSTGIARQKRLREENEGLRDDYKA